MTATQGNASYTKTFIITVQQIETQLNLTLTNNKINENLPSNTIIGSFQI